MYISVAYRWAGIGNSIEFGEKMQSWKHVHVADIKSEYQDDQQNPPAVRRLPDSEWGTRYEIAVSGCSTDPTRRVPLCVEYPVIYDYGK